MREWSLSARRGTSRARRHGIDSPARGFERIGLTREELVEAKSRAGERGSYLVLGKQRGHQRDALAVGFVATDLPFARVHSHEESSAQRQHAMDFGDRTTELTACAVD